MERMVCHGLASPDFPIYMAHISPQDHCQVGNVSSHLRQCVEQDHQKLQLGLHLLTEDDTDTQCHYIYKYENNNFLLYVCLKNLQIF